MALSKKTTKPPKKIVEVPPLPKVASNGTIHWFQTNMSNVHIQEDTSLYAFTRGTNLLYIGLANKQNIAAEVNQTFKRINETPQGLVVWLGYLINHNGDSTEDLHRLIKDTECLLIYRNQPVKNSQCKKSYTGRRPLTVMCEGMTFIKRRVVAQRVKPK
jgi:hypothetical protein